MRKYYDSIDRFLWYAPIAVWILMNIVIGIGMGYSQGINSMLFFYAVFFGFASVVIWVFAKWLFPAFMEFDGREKLSLKKLALYLLSLLALGTLFFLVPIYINTLMPAFPKIILPLVWLSRTTLGIILVASIQLTRYYYQSKLKEIKLEADKATAELNILKNQINPHFLFNTLNNIYGLAYLGDNKAAEMISKLSQIMRYLLYDCDRDKVPLLKETELIENYLSLQKLKSESALNVDFYKAGLKNWASFPPMILINFVENCFKHSDLETNPDAWIKISLELEDKELTFHLENTTKKEVEKILFESKGIGLTNSVKLLEAHYPKKHKLHINKDNGVYELDLKIQL
ncbi:MAG: sensor histidine kinase [Cytophagales bacterium]|nr:sensor histidine kinase [Cytophagales bacterium]